jgi:hypothetical protein
VAARWCLFCSHHALRRSKWNVTLLYFDSLRLCSKQWKQNQDVARSDSIRRRSMLIPSVSHHKLASNKCGQTLQDDQLLVYTDLANGVSSWVHLGLLAILAVLPKHCELRNHAVISLHSWNDNHSPCHSNSHYYHQAILQIFQWKSHECHDDCFGISKTSLLIMSK